MIFSSLIIQFILVSLLPSPVMDAAYAAFDSAGMTPEEMNFDRDWATGVKLADSTVVRCYGLFRVWLIQSVPELLSFLLLSLWTEEWIL